MPETTKLPAGVKVIIGFFLLSIILWTIGQGGALEAYDSVAEWGLQEPKEFVDPVMVEVNRGTGLADIIIQFPLFIIAIAGLRKFRFYGLVASWMVLGITVHWPVVAWCEKFYYSQAGLKYLPFDIGTNLILVIIITFAVWASLYLYKTRSLFD